MKTLETLSHRIPLLFLTVLALLCITEMPAQVLIQKKPTTKSAEKEEPQDIYWNVKAYSHDGQLLRIKAIDDSGKIFDVKAIQTSDDTSVLNVKALVDGKRLPIKLIVEEGAPYYAVKAIRPDGTLMGVKALTPRGEPLNIKGINRTGNVINLRAITQEGIFFNIVAVSPEGVMNYVKGLKMMDEDQEAIINGVPVFAHVKALKQ